jgi:hypothetical protein
MAFSVIKLSRLFRFGNRYLNNRLEVNHSVYDAVVYDSEIEREFAEKLDKRQDIKLFVKLPDWFKIGTPLGTYNPDWAILKEDDTVRECPTPDALQQCDTPDKAADYWRMHIATHPHFNPECECLAVLLLNTRRKVKGHHLVSIGIQDTILVHSREVFRLAIMTAASALIVMHNHPSGESSPSEADIKVTRDLIRAGQLLKMELVDHGRWPT